MSAEILSLRPTDAELEAAWRAYDAARLRAEELYREGQASTSRERFEAAMEANRLHRAFSRLCKRMDIQK